MTRFSPTLAITFILALCGLSLTLFLSMQSLTTEAVAGCGSGSGCAEVLASRWANLGPIPVSMLGALTYIAVVIALILRLLSVGQSKSSDTLLWLAAPLLFIAGMWFTGLQVVELDATCPYCMASHLIGLTLTALIVFGLLRETSANPKTPLLIATVAGLSLIVGQLALPVPSPVVQRAANPFIDQDGDTIIDDYRYLSLFGGKLQFVLEDVGYIGDPRADQVVVVLFDYACPHCKKLHKLIDEAVVADPQRFVVVPLPLTAYELDNPYLASDNPRFEYSHEIAALSLAVAATNREQWIEFDRWLFEQDQPIDRTAARVKAEQLIGLNALTEQLQGDNGNRITEQIARNIALIGLLPKDRRTIPVTTTPGAPEHLTTRYEDIALLHELLDAAKPNPVD